MRTCDPIGLQKAVLWEQAKGLLRAIVAAEGAGQSSLLAGKEFPFERIEKRVNAFIKEFEDDGLDE